MNNKFLLAWLGYIIMEVIPIIYIRKRKIMLNKEGQIISLNELLQIIDRRTKLYIIDLDGIQKNKPNLCLYSRLSEKFFVWVDAGPRVIGDIVDSIMTGAFYITVREKIWPNFNIHNLREITEIEIFIKPFKKLLDIKRTSESSIYGINGMVFYNIVNNIKEDFKDISLIKKLLKKYRIYIAEENLKNVTYWRNIGIHGLLVNINKVKEFNKIVIRE
jgi:hypothetical protein